MRVQDLKETELKRLEFCKRTVRVVPKSSGVYVLASYFDLILYIGVSKNLNRRMMQHLQTEEKQSLSPWGRVYWFYYKQCLESEGSVGERGWMQAFQLQEGRLPHFNKIEAPI